MITSNLVVLFRLFLSFVLGSALGLEREFAGKTAGFRTFALVSLGATLFTLISVSAFGDFSGTAGANYDPSRVISQIVVGIGFLGGGLILHQDRSVYGLTTAAGLWVDAAIGAAVGCGLYLIAVTTCIISLIILRVLKRFDR